MAAAVPCAAGMCTCGSRSRSRSRGSSCRGSRGREQQLHGPTGHTGGSRSHSSSGEGLRGWEGSNGVGRGRSRSRERGREYGDYPRGSGSPVRGSEVHGRSGSRSRSR